MSEWISVKDRLPEKGEPWATFLVVCRTHGGYEGSCVSVKKASFYPDMPADKNSGATEHYWEVENERDGTSIPFEVTHWMPLPEPPRA